MRARWLLAALALALPRRRPRRRRRRADDAAPADAQALFTDLIVNDPRTSADVRGLLTTGAGFVGSPPQFADLTGDGRMDAVVQVRIPGAAGTVAVYAFSTDGTSDGRLRAVLRNQALYRATVAVAPRTRSSSRCRSTRAGDDVCCPAERARAPPTAGTRGRSACAASREPGRARRRDTAPATTVAIRTTLRDGNGCAPAMLSPLITAARVQYLRACKQLILDAPTRTGARPELLASGTTCMKGQSRTMFAPPRRARPVA